MGTIVTFTMNPALDIATSTDRVIPTHKLRCSPPRYDPGGGGINVARAAHALGGRCGRHLSGRRAGRRDDPSSVGAGRCPSSSDRDRRVHSRKPCRRGPPKRRAVSFHPAGPEIAEADQERCLDQLSAVAAEADFIVASGSLPLGVREDFYARAAQLAQMLGKRFVLDTSGVALKRAGYGIHLLKPSLRELQDLVGREIATPFDQKKPRAM